jgi:outer membrane protein TolC
LLQELVARRDAARLTVRSARADFLPEVFLNASSGRSDSAWPPRDSEWSAGISVSVPLFEGGQRRAALARARASLSEADAELRSGKNDILYTLDESWTAFKDAVGLVDVRRKFLQAAEERARIAQAQYSNGLISFDNWTIIEDELVRARKSLLDSEANAMVAEARWVQARGGTLADDL